MVGVVNTLSLRKKQKAAKSDLAAHGFYLRGVFFSKRKKAAN